jgi:hypothetical protein
MSENCPHCGAPLPVVPDAFCPICRERLDEPPEPVVPRSAPAVAPPAADRRQAARTRAATVLRVTGVWCLVLTVFFLVYGSADQVATTGILALLCLTASVDWSWLRRGARREGQTDE